METLECRRLLTTGLCAPVITTQGDVVTVVGSADDDVVELVLGDNEHRLDFSGFIYTFDAQSVREIRIGGGFGSNTIRIQGSSQDDVASVIGPNASMTSANYTALTFSFQATTVDGGGGSDYAQIYGSPSNDTLQGLPEQTVLTTPSHVLSATLFARVDAYGRGGYDYAQIYGTQQSDHFAATDDYTLLTGPGMTKYTKGFERVDAFGRGGTDRAILLGSARNDSVVAGADYTYLNNGQRLSYAKGFEDVRVSRVAGGFNQATVLDVASTNPVRVGPDRLSIERPAVGAIQTLEGMEAITLRDTSNNVIDDQLAEFTQLLGDLEPYVPSSTIDQLAQRFYETRGRLQGTSASDEILGTAASDEIPAGGGNDVVFAGAGSDLVRGQAGNDSLITMLDDDLAWGGTGNDELRGGSGDDILLGGPGNDIIDGETGSDYVAGGTGNDIFRFIALDETVVITDYDPLQDRLELINIDPADITTGSQWGALTLNHPEGLNIVLLGWSPGTDLRGLNVTYATTATQTTFDPNAT